VNTETIRTDRDQMTVRGPSSSGRLLTIGWAASVAMWAIAYVTMMGPGLAVGELLVALMALALGFAGYIAARTGGGRSSLAQGVRVGLISAAVNLLLVGSLFGAKDSIDLGVAARWVLALFGFSVVFAAIGAALGGRAASRSATASAAAAPPRLIHWPGVFAMVAVAATLLLLMSGGLVTGLRAGLAVPDWPNSFGHNMLLYPLSEMKGGIYYEHAHRLYGMLVGLTTIVLVALVWRTDGRRWLRMLSLVALAIVIVQGMLGALRVTGTFTLAESGEALRPNTWLGIAHGVFGQLVFSTLFVMAAAMSWRWISAGPAAPHDAARRDRILTLVSLAALLLHLSLGVCYRHLRTWHEPPAWALHGHLTMAVVVTVLLVIVALRSISLYPDQPKLAKVGKAVLGMVGLQFVLGFAALAAVMVWREPPLPTLGVVVSTAHQSVGALILAHVALLAAWERRLTRVAA